MNISTGDGGIRITGVTSVVLIVAAAIQVQAYFSGLRSGIRTCVRSLKYKRPRHHY